MARRSPIFLAFDFDGTLAPIVRRAHRARLPSATRGILARLTRSPGVKIAVLSGRSLPDLRRRLGLRGVLLCGNHGLSCSVRGIGLTAEQAHRWRSVIGAARRRLQAQGLEADGFEIEDKELGLTLHLRRAHPVKRRGLARRVGAAIRGLPVDLKAGLEILELKPRVAWNKGSALAAILRRYLPQWPAQGACLFTGDDRTDEDAFRVLRPWRQAALTIKVGLGPSCARYRVRGPLQLQRLLEKILKIRARGGTR